MNFGLDSIIKAFDKAFNLKKNIIALIHVFAALLVIGCLFYIGAHVGMGVSIGFGLIGSLLFYYILIRANYILTYFAAADIKNNQKPNYSFAKASFNEMKWVAFFTPILFILSLFAIGLVEFFAMWILSHIPVASSIIQALIMLPLFAFNFFALILVFFGFGLVTPMIIDQKKGIAETLIAVILTVKRRFQPIILYNLLSGFLLMLLIFTMLFLVFLSVCSAGGPLIQNIFSVFSYQYSAMPGAQMDSITLLIMGINAAVILSFFFAYLCNVQAGINTSIYLAAKEGIDYREKLKMDLNQVKDSLK